MISLNFAGWTVVIHIFHEFEQFPPVVNLMFDAFFSSSLSLSCYYLILITHSLQEKRWIQIFINLVSMVIDMLDVCVICNNPFSLRYVSTVCWLLSNLLFLCVSFSVVVYWILLLRFYVKMLHMLCQTCSNIYFTWSEYFVRWFRWIVNFDWSISLRFLCTYIFQLFFNQII